MDCQASESYERERKLISKGKMLPSGKFELSVGVHQGSVLNLLLFAILMDALFRDCRIGRPWELFYVDDLAIMSDNLEDLKIQLWAWITSLETWGLRLNVLGSSDETQKLTKNIKWP